MRNLLLLLVVLGTLSFTLSKEVTRNVEKASIALGKEAPKFLLKNNNGEEFTLDQFKGKLVYINLWTTWSEPSKEELPYLQEFIDSYSDAVVFINLSVDYQRDIGSWKKYINKQKLKGIHLITDRDWQSDFINSYNVVKIPRAILIDKEGNIINAFAPKPSQKAQLTRLFDTSIK
ncbi:MAG: redoxin domain-containing protein [Flavobacteriaceae bacterium]|nr:redoxin domain-containing protein [Flavobacteriaceae bacterium]